MQKESKNQQTAKSNIFSSLQMILFSQSLKRYQMYLRIEKKEERRLHGEANQTFPGGARLSSAKLQVLAALTGREETRERERHQRESGRSHLICSLNQRDTSQSCWLRMHGPTVGLKSKRWRFVRFWTSPHPYGPATTILVMGQDNSHAHSSSCTSSHTIYNI